MQLNSLPPLSVAIIVVDKESGTNDKGYNKVITLQYARGPERRGKVEMNSFVQIVLRLTWMSIGDKRELTWVTPK